MNAFLSIYRGLRDVFSNPRVMGLIGFTFTLIAGATIAFWLVEGWPLIDAAFFAVVTISTVGYGDLTPETTFGKIICIVYIMVGLGVFVASASAVAEALLKRRLEDPDKD
ncbi:potassium channel family protein [Ovoidimarina sediminis]|uniref:potassium channel family protein n=1 Tax=Ovoidimarina sediminis TaxID=3079856 RepID=UPI00290A9F5B|nr:potassium channel family protein [Rhodophyticola sp. MJ-SS7]MDU8944274.1 potassium channel family protein [Rhodophyticola sp. MJ-SS7]